MATSMKGTTKKSGRKPGATIISGVTKTPAMRWKMTSTTSTSIETPGSHGRPRHHGQAKQQGHVDMDNANTSDEQMENIHHDGRNSQEAKGNQNARDDQMDGENDKDKNGQE